MKAIETLRNEYAREDIFTMRTTELFWRQALSSDLTSESRPGSNKDKSRISIVCCTNYTDSERLPLWLIGKAKQPRPLKNVNLKALGCEWRANSKACMNAAIMVEWLRATRRYLVGF